VKTTTPSLSADLSFLTKQDHWLMGVLNATPDSFYAPSRASGSVAIAAADRLAAENPDVIDLGAESSRPGSLPISFTEEYDRLMPLLEHLRGRWPHIPISIDTQKADIARVALERGASIINDISSLQNDPDMASVIAEAQCPLILMHMKGTPTTMQDRPHYENVVEEVRSFFIERIEAAQRHGIPKEKIILDPGIGFGKTLPHNLQLLRGIPQFTSLGCPLLIGISRKSWVGLLTAEQGQSPAPEDRLEGSIAAGMWSLSKGAHGLRVHDVRATRRALRVWKALETPP
jgi:dihydropteroate synthase